MNFFRLRLLPVIFACFLPACGFVHYGLGTFQQADEEGFDSRLLLALVRGSATYGGATGCGKFSDPFFSSQWHLLNTGQFGGTPGEDARVSGAWSAGYCGTGLSIAVVDDGMEIAHEDLSANVEPDASFNFLNAGTDPTSTTGGHGTAIAGLIAAAANSTGVSGVAPGARLRAYNLLQSPGAANEATAMTRDVVNVDVSANAWGPTDRTGQFSDSSANWRAAIDTGVTTGRDGRGTVYVWAAGDGAQTSLLATEIDDANYNGYGNYYGVLAICAVGQDGKRPAYSEQGANLWVCAHSSNDSKSLATTDLSGASGYNAGTGGNLANANYTDTMTGSRAAAGVAAGAIALVLQANPALSWRDLKLVLAQSARQVDPTDSDWTTNGAGYKINHKYGFGAIDTAAAVSLARGWQNVGSFITYTNATDASGTALNDVGAAMTDTTAVAGTGITKLEYVDITVNITHPYPGDLRVTVTSPAGTSAILAREHSCRSAANTATIVACTPTTVTWRFGSARFLGESPHGNWTIAVQDLQNTASLGGAYTINGNGTFTSWALKFFGS